jgi:hypothetical protein
LVRWKKSCIRLHKPDQVILIRKTVNNVDNVVHVAQS